MQTLIALLFDAIRRVPYSKKIVSVFIGVLAVLFVVASIANYFVPEQEAPLQENTWNEITPGYNIHSAAAAKLGQPLGTKVTTQGTEVYYRSAFASKPNTVVLDTNTNKVLFIREPIVYSEEHTLDQYVADHGQPDLELFAHNISDAVKAHIFLQDGLVVFAHVKNDTVEEKWYFEPKYDAKTFLFYWGQDFSESSGVGEIFR